jgi:Holliday junction resolvase RusA-like endonuclease
MTASDAMAVPAGARRPRAHRLDRVDMSVVLDTFIPVTPVGKARPRVARHGTFVHAYTPPVTAVAEQSIRRFVREHLGDDWQPVELPIRLSVTVFRPLPHYRVAQARAGARPAQRPDLDNYVKLVVDALTARPPGRWGVWRDDAQIVELVASKRYAVGGTPGWQVLVELLQPSVPVIPHLQEAKEWPDK